ncbi:MAG: isocitrate/isopropylmalate family dehydrogenase [Polyangiaceae bacterium]
MKKVALIGGDGIGPEVVREAKLLLEQLRTRDGVDLELWDLDLGAERYLRDKTTFPQETQERIKNECAAVLLGALGDPRVPNLEYARDILFGIRFGYDLYANVRPIKVLAERLYPLKKGTAKGVDVVVFRENTEGVYVGFGGQFKKGTADEIGINEDVNTRKGVERIIRAAFDFAKRTGRKKVAMSDKSNAMKYAHELWLRVFDEVGREYPEIERRHVYVDALCLYMIQDPSQFEVIVTNNLFGDIVTDLGAGLQGGLGMAASANVHASDPTRVAMFEPVHGSAPPLVGKDLANPFAAFLTVGMMLTHLGFAKHEERIERAIAWALEDEQCTPDVGGRLGTRAAAEWVRSHLS